MRLRTDISFADVVKATRKLSESEDKITHLGICPMSEELVKVPIELAMEYDFPLLFVASRNQVSEDEGGGYVMGLSQGSFLQKIEDIEKSFGLNSGTRHPYLRFVSVDHCGPWYKECEKHLGEEEAMQSVKRTLTACISAGYAGIHIDCSFKPPSHVKMDEAKIIKLTADLFEFAENERISLGKPPVSYEIGTEETVGSGILAEHFRESINSILRELKKRNLPLPTFVVGRTGTKVRMLGNIENFDYTAAGSLPAIAAEFNMAFKEHNADYLSDLILSLHPEYGITAANVGPCFAAAQTRALLDLADWEEKRLGDNGSDLYQIMSLAVLEKAPFGKWLREGDRWTAEGLKGMRAELRAVTLVAGRYVYYDEKVKEATTKLYRNLKERGIVADPETHVISAVKKAIMRYVDAFNLRGSTSRILSVIEGGSRECKYFWTQRT